MLTAQYFCDAFAEQWNSDAQNNWDGIHYAFQNNTRWTALMLENQDSFLSRLADSLGYQISKEYAHRDAVYYRQEDINNVLFSNDSLYLHCLQAIIEHENGENVQAEMFEMLILRSPLKVLIFYDYDEFEKVTPRREKWLDDKLNDLLELGNTVNAAWPEAEGVEYLFLVGNRLQENEIPVWRCWIIKSNIFHVAGAMLA